jgi:phosphotriesterase-related protein
MVHTNALAKTGLLALDSLTNAGVDARRIVIAHAGDSNDLGYLRAIADSGASLGCDRFGIAHFNPDEKRVETLAALLAQGSAESVHLGHDAACFYDFMYADPFFADEKPDYLHISTRILPALLARGVAQEQIDTMLSANPRRFFTPLA